MADLIIKPEGSEDPSDYILRLNQSGAVTITGLEGGMPYRAGVIAWDDDTFIPLEPEAPEVTTALEQVGEIFRVTIADETPLDEPQVFTFDGVDYPITRRMLEQANTTGSVELLAPGLDIPSMEIGATIESRSGAVLVSEASSAEIIREFRVDGTIEPFPYQLSYRDADAEVSFELRVNGVVSAVPEVMVALPMFEFDALYPTATSRGVMFAPDPSSAFSNLGATTPANDGSRIAAYTDLSPNGLSIARPSGSTSSVSLVELPSGNTVARTTSDVSAYVSISGLELSDNMTFAVALRLTSPGLFVNCAGTVGENLSFVRIDEGSDSNITGNGGAWLLHIDGVARPDVQTRGQLYDLMADLQWHTLIFTGLDMTVQPEFATDLRPLSHNLSNGQTQAGVEHGRYLFCDQPPPGALPLMHDALMNEVV